MATFHLNQTTTATPEQFVAGLTDFGPGRAELFGNSADKDLKVHDESPGHADVTEGSRGIWERLSYDWSDPRPRRLTTTDSNTWGGHSGHTYTFTRQSNGTTPCGSRRYTRGQEPQGTGDRGRAQDHRQARAGKAAGKDDQGHRSSQLRRNPLKPRVQLLTPSAAWLSSLGDLPPTTRAALARGHGVGGRAFRGHRLHSRPRDTAVAGNVLASNVLAGPNRSRRPDPRPGDGDQPRRLLPRSQHPGTAPGARSCQADAGECGQHRRLRPELAGARLQPGYRLGPGYLSAVRPACRANSHRTVLGRHLDGSVQAPDLLVEVPHPAFDTFTNIVGVEAFRLQPGTVLVVAGARRHAVGGLADVAHNDQSLFHEIVTTLAAAGLDEVQLHVSLTPTCPAPTRWSPPGRPRWPGWLSGSATSFRAWDSRCARRGRLSAAAWKDQECAEPGRGPGRYRLRPPGDQLPDPQRPLAAAGSDQRLGVRDLIVDSEPPHGSQLLGEVTRTIQNGFAARVAHGRPIGGHPARGSNR